MAVHPIISKLSIFLRYETQLAEKGFARWTRMEDHDDRFNNLKTNLLEIGKNKKLDSIKFYERVLDESGTTRLKCWEGFEVKDLEKLKTGVQAFNMKSKIEQLVERRNGDLKELQLSFKEIFKRK
jgi:hypothetical protein